MTAAIRWTPEQLAAHQGRVGRKDFAQSPKPSKHRNKWCEWNGMRFQSMKECERYQALVLLERAGEISNLRRQITYPLIVEGELICNYIADAVYVDKHGREVVEDTKSEHTRRLPLYRAKFKLFRALKKQAILEV